MAKISRQKLKDYFFPTSKPLVVQFFDWIDSFVHKDDTIPYNQVDGLGEALDANKEEVRDLIADATSNNKTISESLAKLNAEFPPAQNKKDWYAFVGAANPREKYIVTVDGGAWTPTGEMHKVGDVDLAEYAKIVNPTGDKVVYAPNGSIDTTKLLEKSQLNFGEFLDTSNKDSQFIKSEFIIGKSLSNDTGVEIGNNNASISNYIDISNYVYLYTNNDRTMVFYDNNKVIKAVVRSINSTPQLTTRKIDLRGTSHAYVRFTIASEFVDKVYCYTLKQSDIDTGITSDKVRHNGTKVSEIFNGIDYQFGVKDNPIPQNKFTDNIRVSVDHRHSDETGLNTSGYPGFSTADAFAIDLKIGDILVVNTNQTVVFYTEDKSSVYHFIPSVSTAPIQRSREIVIDRSGIKNMAFTFLTSWGRQNMFAYIKTVEKPLSGVPAKTIVHNNKRLDALLTNMTTFDKGPSYGIKNQLEFTEEVGIVGINGSINNTVLNGIVAKCTKPLEKNSVYYIEFKDIISGQICASVGGMPLTMAGRKTMVFKTDSRDGQNLALWVKGDQAVSGVYLSFDIRGKYKAYKIEEPNMAKSVMKLPAVANDLSALPVAEIPEPLWVIWNLYGNYNVLTSTTNYNPNPHIVEYLDSNGYYFQKYAIVGGQGRTSMTFENHNSKYKLTNLDGSKFSLKIGDWLPRSTFHFKVNFSDFAQLNNPATASFITDWYRDASDPKFFYPWNNETPFDLNKVQLTRLYDKRPRGIIGAIPASIRTYWNHRSCGTMNMNAFAENFFLDDKNPLHRGFRGDTDHTNKWRWEEMCSDTEGEYMSAETWEPFANWYTWMKTNSTTANMQVFKDGDGVKYDKQNLIDSWLFAELCLLRDNLWANQVWISYDSEKYYYMWYDMDSAFGLSPVGQVESHPSAEYRPNGTDQYLWTQVKRSYSTELSERYKELRDSGRFSVKKFREIYGNFQSRFNYEWFEMDFHTWLTRHSTKAGSFASLDRILWFIEERLKFLDNKYGYTN